MKKDYIRTEFPYYYQEKPVIVHAMCEDVFLDTALDLRFTFFDEDGLVLTIEYDEDELAEVEMACIEKLGEAKDELIYDQLELADNYMI